MSNHDGGYLLNYTLDKLNEAGAFKLLGSDKTYELIDDIVQYATRKYDCNEGEILEGLSADLGICACRFAKVAESVKNLAGQMRTALEDIDNQITISGQEVKESERVSLNALFATQENRLQRFVCRLLRRMAHHQKGNCYVATATSSAHL